MSLDGIFFLIMLLNQDNPSDFSIPKKKKKKKKKRKVNKCFYTCDFNEIYIYESLSFWWKAKNDVQLVLEGQMEMEFRKLTH